MLLGEDGGDTSASSTPSLCPQTLNKKRIEKVFVSQIIKKWNSVYIAHSALWVKQNRVPGNPSISKSQPLQTQKL